MNFTDLKNRVYFLTGTDSSSYTDANLTLALSRALERVVTLINNHDMTWQWDDSNYTDLPIATTTITSGQQDYTLATTHLTIDRIEVKDSSGNWTRLKPFDQQQKKRDLDTALSQTTSGVPTEYDLIGSSIFLYPTPNFTQAASLKVYFTRGPLLFSYVTGQFSDSTGSVSSSPGFNALFHDLLALWPAYDYGLAFGKQNTNQIYGEIQRKESDLITFYGQRNRDERGRFVISTDSNK